MSSSGEYVEGVLGFSACTLTERLRVSCQAAGTTFKGTSGLLPLRQAELHLWVAPIPDRDDEALALEQDAMLDVDERLNLLRFRTAALRRRYRTTRALVRTVLSYYVPVPPSVWVFATSSHGRPYIHRPTDAASALRFNVTHSDQLVVLLVGTGRELGVDVEKTSRYAPMVIADEHFATRERAALARLSAAQRASRFWDYWTLKESYVKARGLGLSIPLDGISFSFVMNDRITVAVDPTLGDRASRWRFWQFALQEEHRLAVCAEALPGRSCDFRAWLIVPTGGIWPLHLQCLRWSA